MSEADNFLLQMTEVKRDGFYESQKILFYPCLPTTEIPPAQIMFVDLQFLSNMIKHYPTRPGGKMFGNQTVFDRVLSPNIYRFIWTGL